MNLLNLSNNKMNFLDKFNIKKNIKFELFKKTFEISEKRNLKIIVETKYQVLLSQSKIN
jgi:hypothetical protein